MDQISIGGVAVGVFIAGGAFVLVAMRLLVSKEQYDSDREALERETASLKSDSARQAEDMRSEHRREFSAIQATLTQIAATLAQHPTRTECALTHRGVDDALEVRRNRLHDLANEVSGLKGNTAKLTTSVAVMNATLRAMAQHQGISVPADNE